jgi:xanthine dehydrogenase small subunit
MAAQTPINFTLNGTAQSANCRADMTVLEWLRTMKRLTGTKEGCAEGDCGACSILLSKQGDSGYSAVNSCILSMGQIAGCDVLTVEGLKSETYHPLQVAMAENGSSQCGFCTPGIVMSLAGLLANTPEPNEEQVHDALAGNLCRCTGYKPIVEAALKIAKNGLISLPKTTSSETDVNEALDSSGTQFYRPKTLANLFDLRAAHPSAILLGGGTDLGVALAEHESEWPEVIWTSAVSELRQVAENKDNWTFGSAVTWQEILNSIGDTYPSLSTLIRRFGSTQIRYMGTIGGNIGTASPIGDGPPALIALGAKITLASAKATREIALEDFFLDYRKTALSAGEIIKSVTIPKPVKGQHFRVWKVSKRYDQDISTVCGAFNLIVEGDKITSARVAFGGMAAIPKRAQKAEELLLKMAVENRSETARRVHGNDTESVRRAYESVAEAIRSEFAPLTDWRGTAAYRLEVAGNLAIRLGAELAGETVEVMA